jgi:hypothetical protein
MLNRRDLLVSGSLSNRIMVSKFVAPAQQQPLARFFQNNPTLELLKDNLPAYLTQEGEKAFAGIDAKDRPAVIANTRIFQRVLRMAPNVDVAQNLLELGIKSATQIAMLGQQAFFLKATAAGLTEPEAAQVIFRATPVRLGHLMSRAAIVATIVTSSLALSSPSFAASDEELAHLSDKMSGAFKCSIYAQLFDNQKEQKRLFQIGLKAGRNLVEGIKGGHVFGDGDEMMQYFLGVSTDFVVGQMYASDAEKAYNDIPLEQRYHTSKDNTQAKLQYRNSNCSLIQ